MMSRSNSARRGFSGFGAVIAATVLLTGTALACPVDPGTAQSAAGEGQHLGAHAAHGSGAVGKTAVGKAAVGKTAAVSEAIKGVEHVGTVPDAKDATSLVFMDYGPRGGSEGQGDGKNTARHKRTIMYVSGR